MKLIIKSDYVIANQDVKTGDIVTFLNEGEWRKLPNDPNKELLTFQVELPSGARKLISVNKTSQAELMASWGDESKNWIGRSARVSIEKTRAFGKIVWPIYLEAEDKGEIEEDIPVLEDDEIATVEIQDDFGKVNFMLANNRRSATLDNYINGGGEKPKEDQIVFVYGSKGEDIIFGEKITILDEKIYTKLSEVK